ncbi:MAG: hypothetical protein ABIK43_07435, partial [candidate division WOR-3 bacterium]
MLSRTVVMSRVVLPNGERVWLFSSSLTSAAGDARIRTPMRVYNTLTRQKEDLVTVESNRVKIYTCGPTVYMYAHVGNFRA